MKILGDTYNLNICICMYIVYARPHLSSTNSELKCTKWSLVLAVGMYVHCICTTAAKVNKKMIHCMLPLYSCSTKKGFTVGTKKSYSISGIFLALHDVMGGGGGGGGGQDNNYCLLNEINNR